MISQTNFRKLALSLPGTEEHPHFTTASFRANKKIFATLWEKENRAMLTLSPVDQSVFCSYDKAIFSPVPGSWGAKGATFVDLGKVPASMFKDALQAAYAQITTPSKPLKKK